MNIYYSVTDYIPNGKSYSISLAVYMKYIIIIVSIFYL